MKREHITTNEAPSAKGSATDRLRNRSRSRAAPPTESFPLALQDALGNRGTIQLLQRGRTLDVPMIQRKPTDGSSSAPPAPSIASAPVAAESTTAGAASKSAATALIVEDSVTELTPGQMKKSDFLAQLRVAVGTTAQEALAGTVWSAVGCPWIDHWFGYYAGQDAQHIERAVRIYAPGAAGAATAIDYIPFICGRIRQGVATWIETGEVAGVPEAVSTTPAGVAEPEGGGGLLSNALSAGASLLHGVAGAVGGLLFKSRDGGPAAQVDPRAVPAELGPGHSLESGTRARMESAFGTSFGHVRAHTDANAAELSGRLNARAFTVGQDVAFASGEYRPGTPIGDALIAHELAHVLQQGGSHSPSAAAQHVDASRLEQEAGTSAAAVVAAHWANAKRGWAEIRIQALPRLRSGLSVARCRKTESPKPSGLHYDEAVTSCSSRLSEDQLAKVAPGFTEYEMPSKASMLKNLEAVDVGGVYVFFGHGAITQGGTIVGVNADDKTIFGAELEAALSSDRNPPTLVVLGGCTSGNLLPYVTKAGVPVAMGFSAKLSNVVGANAVQVFLNEVLGGSTFAKAQAEGDKAAAGGGLLSGADVIMAYSAGYHGSMTLKQAQKLHRSSLRAAP